MSEGDCLLTCSVHSGCPSTTSESRSWGQCWFQSSRLPSVVSGPNVNVLWGQHSVFPVHWGLNKCSLSEWIVPSSLYHIQTLRAHHSLEDTTYEGTMVPPWNDGIRWAVTTNGKMERAHCHSPCSTQRLPIIMWEHRLVWPNLKFSSRGLEIWIFKLDFLFFKSC